MHNLRKIRDSSCLKNYFFSKKDPSNTKTSKFLSNPKKKGGVEDV